MTARRFEHTFRPRNAAIRLMESQDGEVLLSGPAGTGKSRACLEKLNWLACYFPGMRGLILRKTMASLGASALVTWERDVIPELLATQKVAFFGGSPKEPAQYRYKNGSRIVVGGMDNPNKIMSTEYDMIYVQESIELNENDWESCTIRLRNGVVPYQQLIADTNPDADTHWLKVRCNTGKTTVFESRHEDNPVYVDDAGNLTPEGVVYLGKLNALSGVRYKRYRLGLWVGAEGQVYETYDPAVHHIERFDIPHNWARWWSVDFGFTNPFVLQCWAEDPDGRLYLYREIYHTKRTVEVHAKDILAQVTDDKGNWTEPKPRQIICDHDAEGRATFEKELGLSTTAARKSVLDGIQATEVRFKNAADGKPRLFLMKNSLVERDQDLVNARRPTCTAEEIPVYIWDIAPGKPPKDQPRKENDHGCDAMRYLDAQWDLGGKLRVRFV